MIKDPNIPPIFKITDVVRTKEGIEGTITSLLPDDYVIIMPIKKGLPITIHQNELTLVYSFLSKLSELKSNEELQALLSVAENLLATQNLKEKKPRKTTSESESNQSQVVIEGL